MTPLLFQQPAVVMQVSLFGTVAVVEQAGFEPAGSGYITGSLACILSVPYTSFEVCRVIWELHAVPRNMKKTRTFLSGFPVAPMVILYHANMGIFNPI